MTARDRQAALRRRRAAAGIVAVTVYVPEAAAPEFKLAAAALCRHPHLALGPLRDPLSGRLVRLDSGDR